MTCSPVGRHVTGLAATAAAKARLEEQLHADAQTTVDERAPIVGATEVLATAWEAQP